MQKWYGVGVLPINRLDASVPDRGLYPVMIWYLQRGSKPISGVIISCGRYPVNGVVYRVGAPPSSEYGKNLTEGNYRGFICP